MQSKRNHSHSCWKLITVFSVIVGTFPFTSLVLTLGRAADGASAASESESAKEKNARLMFSAELEAFSLSSVESVPALFAVFHLLVCVASGSRVHASWQPLTMTNKRRILQSGRSGFGSVIFVLFIPSLSNSDRDDEWGSEVSLCLSEPDTTRL